MSSVFPVGERILLTLWVGGMWVIGYVVAPTLFHVLATDHVLAGRIAGQLFSTLNYIGLVCGGLLLLGAWPHNRGAWRRSGRFWALAVMLAIVVVAEFVLQPMMVQLKTVGLSAGSPAAAQFGHLHGIASTLFLINSLLGLGLVAFGPRGQGC